MPGGRGKATDVAAGLNESEASEHYITTMKANLETRTYVIDADPVNIGQAFQVCTHPDALLDLLSFAQNHGAMDWDTY